MKRLAIMFAFVAACASDKPKDTIDANIAGHDAPTAPVDAPGGNNSAECMQYCTDIESACTAGNDQYYSMGDCMATCATFAAGTVGAMSGNSLACRISHTALAKSGPIPHCLHAGPGGDGKCGTNCEGFCQLVTTACTGAYRQYDDTANCLDTCGKFAMTSAYAINATGNTLACRLYHATLAAANPSGHCSHTAAASTVCQ